MRMVPSRFTSHVYPLPLMLTVHGVYEVEGAPVVNMFAAALKLAENGVTLKPAFGTVVCKKSIYLGSDEGWDQEIPIPMD